MSELNRVPNQSNLTGSGSSQEHGKQAAVFASMADNLSRRTRSRKITKRILALVSAFVLVLTSLSLMEPAETMESPVYCGLEAHTHKDECYGEPVLAYPHEEIEPVIVETREYVNWFVPHVHTDACKNAAGEYICGWDERYVHKHNEWCYDEEGNLVCGLEERSAHVHTASCYEEVRTLSCGLEESVGHVHTDACYALVLGDKPICGLAESDGHVHLDSCYGNVCGLEEHVHSVENGCYDEEGNLTCEIPEHEHTEECIGLTCGKTEGAGAHHHTEECYEKVQTLVCGKTEGEGAHQHTDACYTVENVVTCGYDLHKHDASCGTEGNYTCGHLEIPVFVSSETNWATIRNIVVPGHAHGPECYVRPLVCGKVEHVHVSECFDENYWKNHEDTDAEEVAQPEAEQSENKTEDTDGIENENITPSTENGNTVPETTAPAAEEAQNVVTTTEVPAVEETREPAEEDDFVEMMDDEADDEETYKEETAEQGDASETVETTVESAEAADNGAEATEAPTEENTSESEVTEAPVDEATSENEATVDPQESVEDNDPEQTETQDDENTVETEVTEDPTGETASESDETNASEQETKVPEATEEIHTDGDVTETDTYAEDLTGETAIDTEEEGVSTPTDLQDKETAEEASIDTVVEESISTPTDLSEEQDEATAEDAIQVESSIPVSVETENADLNGATITVIVDENKEAVWNQIQQMLSEQNTQVVLTNARGRRNAARTQADAEVETAENEVTSMTGYTVFDITLTKGEENISETGAITFTLNPKLNVYEDVKAEYPNATGFTVSYELYHLHGESVDTIVPQVEYNAVTGEVKAITFTTENLSSFVLSYTVDFSYTDEEGNEYTFSMPGNGVLLLSELFEQLHIDVDVADVEDVTFTNYDLLSVERVEENTTIELGVDDGENEIWAVTDPLETLESLMGDNNTSAEEKIEVSSGDWILRSLEPFTSNEELTIVTKNQKIVVLVTDEQFNSIDVSDPVDLAAWAAAGMVTLNLSTDSATQNVDRDASFDVKVGYVFTPEALKAIQGYVDKYHTVPSIVYDFSSTLADPALKDSISGGTQYLSTGKRTVGTITFESTGRVVMDITDWRWFADRSSLRGNFTFEIETQASGIDDSGSETYTFPGTSDTIDVKYKESYTIKNKTYNAIDNGDGSYRLDYSVEFKTTADLSSLQYIDTYTGMQTLDAGSVKVNGDNVSVQASNGQFTYDFPKNSADGQKVAAGTYKVEYSTNVTKEQYEAMQKGTSSQEVNTAKWKINGGDPKDGGTTTYTITRPTDPVPPVPVEKASNKENQEVQPEDTITYTVSFGDPSTDLAGLRIIDNMTDLQTLVSGSMFMTIGGQSVALPNDFIKYYDDNSYSTGNVNVFDYTFPENETRKGPVVITYTTKVIDKDTAKANNIYDGVTVSNVGQEGRGWKQDRTDSSVTYDKEEIINVDKSVTSVSAQTDDGKWRPGATVNYQIKIGDGTVNLANVRVTDRMTDLQTLNRDSVQISFDGGITYTSLTDGIVYADDGVYGTNEIDVLDLILPVSAGNGPVYIRYSTTVISQETINAQNLNNDNKVYGEKTLNNTATGGNRSDSDGGNVPYEEEPKFPAEKTVKSTGTYVNEDGEIDALEEGNTEENVDINGQEVKPGEIVTYTITVGDAGTSLDGVKVMDDFTDIQKLVEGSVKVTLPSGTAYDMPIASDHWSADGVVWTDYEDDGMYSTNGTVRVFYYTFPEGAGNGPATITYQAQIITEDDAKTAGFTGLKSAINSVVVGNNNPKTEIKPRFPEDLQHNPVVSKEGTGIDAWTNTVKWRITVDKDVDSAFPLTDVYVYEHVGNESQYYIQTALGYSNWTGSEASWYDMLNAVVSTESGNILTPIKDYTVHKGIDNSDKPYFYFPNLEEKVYIDLEVHLPLDIAENKDGVEAENRVHVNNGPTVLAQQEYHATDITVGKFGELTETYKVKGTNEERAVIKWTVYINAAKSEVVPDTEHIYFNDIVPEGLELVDYNSLIDDGVIDTSKFSMAVTYSNEGSASKGPSGTYIFDNYDNFDGLSVGSDKRTINQVDLQLSKTYTHQQYLKEIYRNEHGHDGRNDDPAVYGLSYRKLEITYYTTLAADEWEKIASSADGSKTYENIAHVTDGGTRSWDGTGEETISIEKPIDKFDDTNEKDGIVVGSDGKTPSTLIAYRVNINDQKLELNGGKTLTLTDRIATNIELDTDSVRLYPGTLTKEQVDEIFSTDEGIRPGDAGYEDLTISYNGDTRALTINGLHDATAYTFVYKADTRAQGEDTFTNTATLIGGGSHSSTVTDKHDIETLSSGIAGESLTMSILKVDENNITTKISDAEFDLYELTLGIDTSSLTDEEWLTLLAEMDSKDPARMAEASRNFNIVRETKIGTSVYNSEATIPDYVFPDQAGAGWKEKTVYYFVETKPGSDANGTPYTLDTTRHYFVLYPAIIYNGSDPDEEAVMLHQKIAWALDDATQYANNITIASLASETQWKATNILSEETSIKVSKIWENDADNFFETRPEKGITLHLMQVDEDGVETEYTAKSPIVIRASKYEDIDGNARELWPDYTWTKLPAHYDGNKTYKYYVVEDAVEGYTTVYTTTDPIDGGNITVTNRMIPKSINISAHKTFSVPEGTELPEQVILKLYRYTTTKEGVTTGPIDIGISQAVTANNNWSTTFDSMPTTGKNGETYKYVIVEDTKALERAGYSYLVEYEGNNDDESLEDKDKGIVEGEVEVINNGPGAIKLTKNVTVNGKALETGDSAADGDYIFHIYDAEGNELEDGKSPVTISVVGGQSEPVLIQDLDAGEYVIREQAPTNGTTLSARAGGTEDGDDGIKVKVIGGADTLETAVSAGFTNNIEKTRVVVDKTWVNANRDASGKQIVGTNNDWPAGVTVEMTLKKTKDGGKTLEDVDAPQWYTDNNETWSDKAILSSARQSYIFDNLDEFTDEEISKGYEYTIEETAINGITGRIYETHVNSIDDNSHVEVINAETTNVEFTKKWVNTSWNQTDKVKYNREYLRIKVKLHRYYMNNGKLTETPYTDEELNKAFGKEMVLYGRQRNMPEWGLNALNETSKYGSDEWSLFWEDIPTVGEVDGKTVEYIYKVEETMLYYSHDVPGGGEKNNHIEDDCWKVVTSEDGTTITNIYIDDTQKSVAFEKVWSDGNERHALDWVDIQLYRSKISPSGYGKEFTGTIQVDTSNWLDTKGNTAAEPDGSVMVKVTDVTKGTTVGTYELKKGDWSTTFTGTNGHQYSVVATAKDGTDIVKVAQSCTTITGEYPTVTIKGRVEAPNHIINLQGGSYTFHTGSTTESGADILISFPAYRQVSDLEKINIEVDNATLVSSEAYATQIDHGTYIEETTRYIRIVIKDIIGNVTINLKSPGNYDSSGHSITPVVGEGSSNATDTFPEDTPVAVTPSVPAASYLEKVTKGDAGTETAIALNKGSDDEYEGVTYKGIQAHDSSSDSTVWAYSWAGLPAVDESDGEQWYYYVKEMHYGSGKSTPTAVKETTYAYEYSEDGDMSVTKVIATNVVQGGALEVTKSVTSTSLPSAKTKEYSFTVKASDGKYVQNTNGDLGTNRVWFRFTDGKTVKFPNLPVGVYTIEEDEAGAKIAGYTLRVDGTGDVTVIANTTKKVTVENDYTQEKGSLKVAKTFKGLTYAELDIDQKAALAKISFTVKNSDNETVATFNLSAADMGNSLEKTIGNLTPGTYTVTETIPDDSAPGGYTYNTTTVSVTGGTGGAVEDGDDPAATATVEANKTVTVTFDNEYETSSGKLIINKSFTGNAASKLTADQKKLLKFQVTGPDNYSEEFIYGENDDSKNATWSGDTLTISNLTIGSYTVTETGDAFKDTDGETDLYIHSKTIKVGDTETETVTIDADGETVSIENKYDEAKLEVTKSVSGDLDALPGNKTITFTITGDGLTTPIIKTYPTDFTNGKLTLTHKDGIKLGTEYTVTESGTDMNLTGYTRTTTITAGDSSTTKEQGDEGGVGGNVTTDSSTGNASISFNNKYDQKTVSLAVNKTWAFADPSNVTKVEGKEWPAGVTVHVVVYSKTGDNEPSATTYTHDLTAEAPSYTFTGLPEYDGENKIEYSVVEAGVTGLDSTNFNTVIEYDATTGYTIKNTEKEAGLTIIKVFEGPTLTDAEKNAITFIVTGNGLKNRTTGDAVESLTKTYADLTDGQWVLNQTDGIVSGGTYTVKETSANVQNYTRVSTVQVDNSDAVTFTQDTTNASAAGNTPAGSITLSGTSGTVTITNTYTKEKTSVSGTKTWVDMREHINASEITLTLKRTTKPVREDSNWETVTGVIPTWDGNTYTFSDLDKYVSNDNDPATEDDEKEYVYNVEETSVTVMDGENPISYKQETNGNDFTNIELTEIEATKTWTDIDVKQPRSVKLKLTRYKGEELDRTFKLEDITLNGTVGVASEIGTSGVYGQEGPVWTYKWTKLPKYYVETTTTSENGVAATQTKIQPYTYKVEETEFTYGSDPAKTYYVEKQTDGSYKVYTSDSNQEKTITGLWATSQNAESNTITNTQKTSIKVTKVWKDATGKDKSTETQIKFTVWQHVEESEAKDEQVGGEYILEYYPENTDEHEIGWEIKGIQNLPKKTVDGINITYYVKESSPAETSGAVKITYANEDTTASSTASLAAVSSGMIIITNEDISTTIDVIKVDESTRGTSSEKKLEGARFELMKEKDGQYLNYITETFDTSNYQGDVAAATSNSEGKLSFTGLVDGKYKIVEKESPDGYNLTSAMDIYFTITGGEVKWTNSAGEEITNEENDKTKQTMVTYTKENGIDKFTVGNTPGINLPSTGGIGDIRIIGLVLSLLSLSGLALDEWKRRGRVMENLS